jgi:hypothetical protein
VIFLNRYHPKVEIIPKKVLLSVTLGDLEIVGNPDHGIDVLVAGTSLVRFGTERQ